MSEKFYTLMNKEIPLCDFTITGEGEMEACHITKKHSEIPFWCEPIGGWVNNRSAAKHREHVKRLLEQCGGRTISGFIALTHCLSLTDTLWIKSSQEDVKWEQLSLYTNRFDETISRFSFDGNGLFGIQMSTTSPELTTDGSYDKCWMNEADGIHLIKAGSTGARNTGLEPYSEVLASQVFEVIAPGSVKYKFRRYDGRAVSDCKMFTSEKYGYRPVSHYIKQGIKYTIPDLLEIYKEFGSEDAFRRMVVADCITLNMDRHYGNFGFLVDNDSFERIRMNPLFDFNVCFAPYAEDGFDFGADKDGSELSFDDYLSKRGPVIGSDFVEPAKMLLTPEIEADVKIARDIELEVESDEKFTKKRVEQMNMVKNVQCDRILGIEAKFYF